MGLVCEDVATGEQTCYDLTACIIVCSGLVLNQYLAFPESDSSLVAEQSQPSKSDLLKPDNHHRQIHIGDAGRCRAPQIAGFKGSAVKNLIRG